MAYPFSTIEKKWQDYWTTHKTFATHVHDTSKPKYYVLDMFPYPSGEGLHVGHPEGYTATDIVARYKRHCGFNVLHPMGWDAFGLPAEQYAMKTNVHPSITTGKNITNFRRQLQMLGFAYDWDRQVNTTDPEYYRWTQWIFLTLYNTWFDYRTGKGRPIADLVAEFERTGCAQIDCAAYCDDPDCCFTAAGWNAMEPLQKQKILGDFRLVYQDFIPVNWCEGLGSVLANEEVDEWVEKGYSVERRPMRQWMMRITAYADRLLQGLEGLDWPASTADMQRNWIGRSAGAELTFATESGAPIHVFTTRPDTLFGATFVTVAPEHPLVAALTTDEQRALVQDYVLQASRKSDRDRQASPEKTGVFTGSFAVNPATGERVAVWTGDYVLAGYGTGAVMGVPAHDERDFAFAQKFGLPIRPVIQPPATHPDHQAVMEARACYTGSGAMVNSGSFDGQNSEAAKQTIVEWLGDNARSKVRFKLRDWLFSRQRYWGEPIPIIHYQSGIEGQVPLAELPLLLPEIQEFKPSGTGESPLALAHDWLNVNHPEHGPGRRETNTMPQWAGSCWYYLRYIDPHNAEAVVNPALEKHWLPVDLYIGGGEHAVLHLLYARFWHNVLFDLGHTSCAEPFRKLIHQGLILGEDSQKMSKSRGNVVNPDDVVHQFGADSLRLFEMFMGPLQDSKPWSTKGLEGVHRFLNRAWRMIAGEEDSNVTAVISNRPMTTDEERALHTAIKKVTEDIEGLRLNTAVSALMVFVNAFLNSADKPRPAMEAFVTMLSPFAPHIAEELWQILGGPGTVADAPWPVYDPAAIADEQVEIVLQVSSRIKGRMLVPAGTDAAELEQLALANQTIAQLTAGKTVRKVIVVKDKLVNVITG